MDFPWKHPHPRIWLCECSPRGDYRLRIEMLIAPSDKTLSYVVTAEWLIGGSDYLTHTASLDTAHHEAEQWAREYEAQDADKDGAA